MPKFQLTRDSKYTTWWRDYYVVEADSKEEAIRLITEGIVDPEECISHEIDDALQLVYPEELSPKQVCTEIFEGHDKPFITPIWNDVNKLKVNENE